MPLLVRGPDLDRKKRLGLIIAGMGALAVTLAIYLLRLDRVVGLIPDDAWYVMLAKALATGQGYTLINSPTPGITPFYPPGFPAALAIFYRLWPDFPDNVWLLKSVSIAAMIGAGFVSFVYFDRHRRLPTPVAFALAFATAIYPALVFLATSTVMSECFFTLIFLATILVIEEAVARHSSGSQKSSSWRYAAAGGALASLAFLTRSIGVALLLGPPIYLLKEKLLKQVLVFAAVVVSVVGPWTLYSRDHAATPEQRLEQGGAIVLPYSTQFWHRMAGWPQYGVIAATDLPGRVWANLSEIGQADIGAIVLYPFYRPPEPGEFKYLPAGATRISLVFSLLALAGFTAAVRERVSLAEVAVPLAMGVSLLWGWEQFRLLLPLVPLFFLYLLMGMRAIARLCRRPFAGSAPPSARGEVILLLIGSWIFVVTSLYGNYEYLKRKYDPVPEQPLRWVRVFEENESFIRYVGGHVPLDAPIAAQNPALLHLYTGHKTVSYERTPSRWELWKRLGVRYVARTGIDPVELDADETRFTTIYRSDGILRLRLLDLGPPSSRPAWRRE